MVELTENKLNFKVDSTPTSLSSRLAPDGSLSKLSESDWNLVRTDDFKQWFGDWETTPEKSSKVVDVHGEPLKIYHGSYSDFEKFDWESNLGKNTSNFGVYGHGNYFTVDKTISKKYGTNIFEGFANIKNPKKLLTDVVDLKDTYSLKLVDEFNLGGIPFDVGDVVDIALENPDKQMALEVLLNGSLVFAKKLYHSSVREYEDAQKISGLKEYASNSLQPRVDYFKRTVDSLGDAIQNSSQYLSHIELVPAVNSSTNIGPFVAENFRLSGYDGVLAYKDTSTFQSSEEFYDGDLAVENAKEIVTYSSDQTRS